jgi:antitoxin ParD1/3/4
MPSRNARNVSLTDELCDFITEQVKSGRFRTASEVVRTALRLLMREAEMAEPTGRQSPAFKGPLEPQSETQTSRASASRP